MTNLLENPTLTGLLAGAGVLIGKHLYNKLTGAADERSIPFQLTEMNLKLAEINATLLLIKNDAQHAMRDHEELKADFWRHVERHHP